MNSERELSNCPMKSDYRFSPESYGHIWGIKDKKNISFMWEAEQTVLNNLRQLKTARREEGAL